MKNCVIYYFTGSGNTYKIGTKVKECFEKQNYTCELIAMEDVEEVTFKNIDYVGLMFPVAIQSTYPNVWAFINQLPQVKGQKVFMIDTMEYFSGGIVGPVKKILELKGYDCVGAIELKMTSSMNTKKTSMKVLLDKNNKAEQQAELFVSNLIVGNTTWKRVPLLSDVMRSISINRDIWTKHSKKIEITHETCVNCNLCIKKCPVSALSMNEGMVKINNEKCVSCMRCVTSCPTNAFSLEGKKVVRLIRK